MASTPSENPLVYVGPVKRGRPSDYTEELAKTICDRIAGNETLSAICLDDDMPNIRTVGRWLMRYSDFAQAYGRARETQMHLEAEEMRDIADNAYEDYYIDWKEDKDGVRTPFVVVNGDSVKRAQLRIATRQWRAERLNRRVYGNSVKHEFEPAVHPANGAEQLPSGLGWLAGQLPEPQAAAGPEPDDSGVGEE